MVCRHAGKPITLFLTGQEQRQPKAGENLPSGFQRGIAPHGLGSTVANQGARGGQAFMDFVVA